MVFAESPGEDHRGVQLKQEHGVSFSMAVVARLVGVLVL